MDIKRLFFTFTLMVGSISLAFLLLNGTMYKTGNCKNGDKNCGRSISQVVSSSSEDLTIVSILKSKMSKLVQVKAKEDTTNVKATTEKSQKIKTAKDVNQKVKGADKETTIKTDTEKNKKIKAVTETNQKLKTVIENKQKPEAGKEGSRNDHNGKRRYLIYQCDGKTYCGGWGDRQRGIASAFVLSIVTNRTFGINMSSPCDLKLFYIPNEVNWFVKARALRGLSSIFVDGMDRNSKMHKLGSWDFNKIYPQDVVYLQTNINYFYGLRSNPALSKYLPQWARTGPVSFFKTAWNMLMKYSAHFEEHVDKMMAYTHDKDLICAHIRLRKNPTIPNDGKTINSISTVSRLWEFLDKYVTNNSRVFIATDSQEVRKMSKEYFKERQFDSGGFIIHIDRQRKWKEACEGFEIALLDQAILSQCKVLVCSESNFSKRAAMMTNIRELFIFKNGTVSKLHL